MASPLAWLRSYRRWVRTGYPALAGERGHVPLLALLGSTLTREELDLIGFELAYRDDPASTAEIANVIESIAHRGATPSDIACVRSFCATPPDS